LLKRIPDGETGGRENWILWQVPVVDRNPAFELIDPSGAAVDPGFGARRRLKSGQDPVAVDFGPLGYADEALRSYEIFARLKSEGIIGEGVKFQVSLPTPFAVLLSRFDLDSFMLVEPAYEKAMLAEIATMLRRIPADQLAIQWDVAVEIQRIEMVEQGDRDRAGFPDVEHASVERLLRLGDGVPSEVDLGYHLCYGDRNHRHTLEPADTTVCTRVTNALTDSLQRSIEWIHLPVPRGRKDHAYFAPMRNMRLKSGTELYLGLVHFTDGAEGTRERISAANDVVSEYGVATECGFGRRPANTVVPLMQIHADVCGLGVHA
jgi:hypothetical protein